MKDKIYHVEVRDFNLSKEKGKHHYFGSLSAIYDVFTREEVELKLESLRRNKQLKFAEYSGRYLTIRKGVIIRKKQTNG